MYDLYIYDMFMYLGLWKTYSGERIFKQKRLKRHQSREWTVFYVQPY